MMIFNDGHQAQGEALPKISRMMTGSPTALAHKKAAWFHAAGLQLPGANYHGGLAEKVTATATIVKGCGSLREATLPAAVRHGTIHPAGGLDTHQQGWRTRHPIATTKPRTICNHSLTPGSLPGVYPFLGGHGSGAKETASPCAFLGLALSCGYPIRLGHSKPRNHPVIYTFCITRSRGPIAALSAIRTISVYATNETEARTRLAGLPLVFLSRSPAREVAA